VTKYYKYWLENYSLHGKGSTLVVVNMAHASLSQMYSRKTFSSEITDISRVIPMLLYIRGGNRMSQWEAG